MGVYINIDVKEIRRGAVAVLNIDDVAFFVNGKDIIAIPDHGDLIDRDALLDSSPVFVTASFGKSTEFISRYKVITSPVVIPAERSEDV